jgi:DNA-binding CsgD family transcriptional regulator
MKTTDEERVVELLALIRGAHGLRHDMEAARRFFLLGMCRLLDADRATWAEDGAPPMTEGGPLNAPSAWLGVGLERHRLSFRKAQPFSEAARALVRVLVEHGWMLDRLLETSVPQRLPRRLRQTLELLLTGCSEKQLALTLQLSTHTVHDYVRELYKRLGVSSRSELFAQALRPAAMPLTAVSFEGAA